MTIQDLIKREGRWLGGVNPKDVEKVSFRRFIDAVTHKLATSYRIPEYILRGKA